MSMAPISRGHGFGQGKIGWRQKCHGPPEARRYRSQGNIQKSLQRSQCQYEVLQIWAATNIRSGRRGKTCLVTVTPLEVLGADVLVGVLGALGQRGHVVPVVPVLLPQVVGVGTGADQADGDTAGLKC